VAGGPPVFIVFWRSRRLPGVQLLTWLRRCELILLVVLVVRFGLLAVTGQTLWAACWRRRSRRRLAGCMEGWGRCRGDAADCLVWVCERAAGHRCWPPRFGDADAAAGVRRVSLSNSRDGHRRDFLHGRFRAPRQKLSFRDDPFGEKLRGCLARFSYRGQQEAHDQKGPAATSAKNFADAEVFAARRSQDGR